MNENILIVGGDVNNEKKSSILKKMSISVNQIFNVDNKLYNGELPTQNEIKKYDLIIWTPDISNEQEKDYPIKKKGSVLICSKVMREGYNDFVAISRIFKMNGNAVIAIYKDDPKKIRFKLIDALGNIWINTNDIGELCFNIKKFYTWTKESIRKSLNWKDYSEVVMDEPINHILVKLIDINNKLSDKVVNAVGKRFFGNVSTRCMGLFPTSIENNLIYVSRRNIDKSKLSVDDFVICDKEFNFYGDNKPSVDSPIQISLYNAFPKIRYMIHGHAYISDADITNKYVPCGDMREVDEIKKVWGDKPKNINLKNHGFLIVAESLEELENIINNVKVSL